jgi:hypothetical protein
MPLRDVEAQQPHCPLRISFVHHHHVLLLTVLYLALLIKVSGSNVAKISGEISMSSQTWAERLLQQVRGVNLFDGDCQPTRVPFPWSGDSLGALYRLTQ